MKRAASLAFHALETAITLLMIAMVIMVFGNVVLRYGFNSGIDVSEEMSRYAFVWLTFLGAIVTLRDNAHVNIEMLVGRLSRRGRLFCMAVTQVIILICSVVIFLGAWSLRPFNTMMTAPVTGIPLSWVSNVAFITATGFFLIALFRLVGILSGRVSEQELGAFAGEPAKEK